jgi:riboflavin synthase
MFTGLVDDVGTIESVGDTSAGRELRIRCRYTDLAHGESIAVNGACLTVRDFGPLENGDTWFSVAAVVTTTDRTTIASWTATNRVNLERAMRLGDRLGGHLVLGHVDGVATVRHVTRREDALLVDVTLPAGLNALMVAHGSVTIDGVSLTVNALHDDGIQLSVIEYTAAHTTLGDLQVNDRVHVEADVLAKHVERLLSPQLARFAGATHV